jgi:hypothetical protein
MRFAALPEMVTLWLRNSHNVLIRPFKVRPPKIQETNLKKITTQPESNLPEIVKSKAFAEFLQGLMQSQMHFFVDLTQTNMATLSQGPTKIMKQMQQAANNTPLPSAHAKPSRVSKRKGSMMSHGPAFGAAPWRHGAA